MSRKKLDMSVDLCGVKLKNPIIPASGTFGYGRETAKFYDISRLGAVSVKGITLKPRTGNPPVRIVETPSGILNSVGLQNPGVDSFIINELPWLVSQSVTVIANISGSSVEEYCCMAAKLDKTEVSFIEVNVSCPNIHSGGKVFAADPKSVFDVARGVRTVTRKPVLIKLSPNVADIAETAKAAEEGGADGISLINTLTGMAIDVKTRKPILANVTGGLSGPAIRPVALRMCYQAAKAVKIPIVGMGGIMSGEDAVMFLLAGCTAVQVGTANLTDPMACVNILEQLERYMLDNGVAKVTELIGALITE